MAGDKSNGLGVASLVLGIVSIVLCWVPIFGLVAGILGIIFSVKQRKRFPNGIATSGLVTGIIGVVFSALYLVYWFFLVAMLAASL